MSQAIDITPYVMVAAGVFSLLWGLRGILRLALIRWGGGVSVGRVRDVRTDAEGEPYFALEFLTERRASVVFEQQAPNYFSPFLPSRSQINGELGREFTVYYATIWPRLATITPGRDFAWGLFAVGVGLAFIFGAKF